MDFKFANEVTVRFAETDKFGSAYHGAYFAWFEVGRTDWLRERGMTYLELSTHAGFMDNYVSALFLPHTDQHAFPSVLQRVSRAR